MKNGRELRFIAQISKKELPWLIIVTLLNAATAALGVYFALAMRNVINAAVAGNTAEVYSAAVVFISAVAAELVLFVFVRILAAKTTARLTIAFRESVFRSLLRKEYSSVSKYHSGEILNRLFNDVSVVSDNVSTLVPSIAGLITRLIGALVAVFLVDKTFALVILCGGASLFVFARAFRGIMKQTHKNVQEAGGKLRSFVQEACENILVIKAFGMEKKIEEGEESRAEEVFGKTMRRAMFSTGASAGFSGLVTCGYVYAVIWGAWKILTGAAGFGYGDFSAIMQLINQIQTPFASLSGSLSRYYSAIASTERLLEICDLPSDESGQECDIRKVYEKLSAISLENVTFAYGDTPVFDSASIDIRKGELTLISGISGIGKSTMIKMLMGVLRPLEGEIKAVLSDGSIAVNAATRGLFAYVPQGNLLMSGTVRENMLLAKADASDDEIKAALSVACAGFLDEMQNGLDSVIGERGSGLSEGQVQRLAIARAVLCGAPILLLDEATSALDEATEREVLENIMSLPGRTCVAISHRSAARGICDREIYVEDGKIKER
ncbi:MAG: ABC transporter ATP-binding protein [Oscillospiraceae bacterium]|nr:ABC transporter ATP-binding protein [Oscillospiraceae bacterium]MBQ6901403.1 ABC transporter ATP-binding protein [Oscillospiraceae bacterium]